MTGEGGVLEVEGRGAFAPFRRTRGHDFTFRSGVAHTIHSPSLAAGRTKCEGTPQDQVHPHGGPLGGVTGEVRVGENMQGNTGEGSTKVPHLTAE